MWFVVLMLVMLVSMCVVYSMHQHVVSSAVVYDKSVHHVNQLSTVVKDDVQQISYDDGRIVDQLSKGQFSTYDGVVLTTDNVTFVGDDSPAYQTALGQVTAVQAAAVSDRNAVASADLVVVRAQRQLTAITANYVHAWIITCFAVLVALTGLIVTTIRRIQRSH